jgi:outer membrane protein OmpA-like peptidoglycan-associated protein
MRGLLCKTAFAVGVIAFAFGARADGLSTSALNPTEVAPTGLIAGSYPASDLETSYYFAIDLKPGDLAAQIAFMGRPNRDKSLEFDLKDPNGKLISYTSIMSGLDANQETARVFPVDSSGRYLIVLKTKGPETTSFQVELGGSAYSDRQPVAAPATPFSRSYLNPSAVPQNGVIAGTFPGGEKKITYYYFAADLKPGDLMTQIGFAGRSNVPKMLEFALLDATGRSVNSNYYVMGELDANSERTRAFPVDSSGRYVLRIGMSGAEGTRFCVLLGGSALADVKPPGCPARAAAAPAAAAPSASVRVVTMAAPVAAVPEPQPAPRPVEVIISRCEERLRVGSDVLFDFDRAEVRAEAEPAMAELSRRIALADKAVMIEGHTDAIGTDTYNQGLSERRALAVRTALIDRGLPVARLNVRGFGKMRPVAPNARADGSDDPEGRQRNRRVEVVINTCS